MSNILPEGFRPMSEAKKDSSEMIVLSRVNGVDAEFTAHYAKDLSGEEQPAFMGWFFWTSDCSTCGGFFAEVPGELIGWKPLPPTYKRMEFTG